MYNIEDIKQRSKPLTQDWHVKHIKELVEILVKIDSIIIERDRLKEINRNYRQALAFIAGAERKDGKYDKHEPSEDAPDMAGAIKTAKEAIALAEKEKK